MSEARIKDIPYKTWLELKLISVKRKITLNKLVVDILSEWVKKAKHGKHIK